MQLFDLKLILAIFNRSYHFWKQKNNLLSIISKILKKRKKLLGTRAKGKNCKRRNAKYNKNNNLKHYKNRFKNIKNKRTS